MCRYGDPTGGGPDRYPSGTYHAAHRQLREKRGSATGRICAACGSPAAMWFYSGTDPDELIEPRRGRRYSLDPARYEPRCRSCHCRGTLPPNRLANPDVERAAGMYATGMSARSIAATLDVGTNTVIRALRAHGVAIRARSRSR